MRLELPVRWEEQDIDSERFGEMPKSRSTEKKRYTYGKLSIDSEDIGPYYDIDPSHIMMNDKLGKVYCVAVPFDDFKKIYTEVSGKAILAIQTTEEYKNHKPKRRDRDNGKTDTDNIGDIIDQ